MKIKIKSHNTKHYGPIEKELILIPREKELVITTDEGKEIASLIIDIMDAEDDSGKITPSKSFYLTFLPKENGLLDNTAVAIIE